VSQEKVEIVRSIYDDWLRGEWATDRFDPEIAMVESETIPGATSAHGLDAVRRYMESFAKYWEEIHCSLSGMLASRKTGSQESIKEQRARFPSDRGAPRTDVSG
jgi:hypothetical protein